MTLISKLKNIFISKKQSKSFVNSGFSGLSEFAGGNISFGNDRQELVAYTTVEWVAACVDRLMKDIGQDFFFEDQKKQRIEASRIDRAIIVPIKKGFFKDDFKELIKRVLGQRVLTGNAFLIKAQTTAFAKIENISDQFIPVSPDRVTVCIDESQTRLLGYEVQLMDGSRIILKPEEVIHFKQNSIFNPFIGIGNVEKMRLMLEGEASGQDYMNEFLATKASPSLAITSEEEFNSLPDYERKMDLLSSKYEGKKKAGKIMYLAGGANAKLNVTQMSLTQKDMQFLELKQYNRQTIISVFGLNTTVMGIPEGSNNAIADTMQSQYFGDINNILKELENALNQQFVNEIDINTFIRFDKYATGNVNEIKEAIATGIMTPNEGSKKIGETSDDSDPTRNSYYIASNLVPLGFVQEITNQTNVAEEEKNIRGKIVDLTNPKNITAIEESFLLTAPKSKVFQVNFLRKALKDRNKIEDKFAFELRFFFREQGKRVVRKFNEEFGVKADPKILDYPEQVASLVYDLDFEGKELTKELDKLHTSGVQKGVMGVNSILASSVNHNLSNPFVLSAVKRLSQRATEFMTKDKTISINRTTWKDITNIIAKGVDEGQTVNQMSDAIGNKFKQYEGSRARLIARTESAAAWDAGAEVAYRELDVRTVDVVGCEDEITDCNKKNIPIDEVSSLVFHPNHTGAIVPSEEI